jgi:hypothetical protein
MSYHYFICSVNSCVFLQSHIGERPNSPIHDVFIFPFWGDIEGYNQSHIPTKDSSVSFKLVHKVLRSFSGTKESATLNRKYLKYAK